MIIEMRKILTCADEGLTSKVKRKFLVPGENVTWDECCEGQLWVRAISKTPRMAKTKGASPDPLCMLLGVDLQLGVGVIRCQSGLNSRDGIPAPSQYTADAELMAADSEDIYRALVCCSDLTLTLDRWTSLGPEGGCFGGEWIVKVFVKI